MRYNNRNEPTPSSAKKVLTGRCSRLSYQSSNQLLDDIVFINANEKKQAFLFFDTVSYFRFKTYLKKTHKIYGERSFAKAKELYCFDEKLRTLLFGALGKIEIALRAQLLKVTQNPFFYQEIFQEIEELESSQDKRKQSRASSLRTLKFDIQREVKRSREDFIKKFEGDIPAWALFETLSFGTISKIFSYTKTLIQKEITKRFLGTLCDKCTKTFPHFVFENWLRGLVYVRNLSHHYSRLWDRRLDIEFNYPKNTPIFLKNDVDGKKIFFALSVVYEILKNIDKKSSLDFYASMNGLIAQYPWIDYSMMGFSSNWRELYPWRD